MTSFPQHNPTRQHWLNDNDSKNRTPFQQPNQLTTHQLILNIIQKTVYKENFNSSTNIHGTSLLYPQGHRWTLGIVLGPLESSFDSWNCCWTLGIASGPLGSHLTIGIATGLSGSSSDPRNHPWMLGTTCGCLERPLDAWNDTWTLETTSGRSEQPLDARNDLWTLGTTPGRLESLLDSHNRR